MNMKTKPLSEIGDGSKGTNSWGQKSMTANPVRAAAENSHWLQELQGCHSTNYYSPPSHSKGNKKKKFYRQKVEKGNWGLGTLPGLRNNFLDLNFEDLKYVLLAMVVVVATVIVFIVCEATWDFK